VTTFRAHVLPAAHGDCILIEYGEAEPFNRVLIDGGTPPVWRTLKSSLEAIPEAQRKLELLVITHIDADHIGGALGLFESGVGGLDFDDIWFNGYRHLRELEEFGPMQGERLTSFLWQRQASWNKAFVGRAVVIPDAGPLPVRSLNGGMKLTLLSPTRAKLSALLPKWESECRKAGLVPQVEPPVPAPAGIEPMGSIDVDALAALPFKEDAAEANGSSIAFLAEYDGRRLLLGADAHPGVLAQSIAQLPGGRIAVDAFKLPHHGSRHNTSPALLESVQTSRYIFSTSGAQFHHPDRETVARIVGRRTPQCELWFNYRSQYAQVWDDDDLREEWDYQTIFPQAEGLTLDL
jgi:hypothetical protein